MIFLGAIVILYLLVLGFRHHYRLNVRQGDLIGLDMGKGRVVTCRVYTRFKGAVTVKINGRLTEHRLNRVYYPSPGYYDKAIL